MQDKHAPGAPGVNAKWTSGAKSGIGKAIDTTSDVAFTISHGILNELFYPREDIACVRDMEFIVTNGENFFSEEKRNTHHSIKTIGRGIPCYQVINTCVHKQYQVKKEIICDPYRNTVLQNVQFEKAKNTSLQLYALLAPHLNNEGNNNNGWIGEYKGIRMLFAEHNGLSLAVACSVNWLKCSVGYVGTSDGWIDLHEHKKLTAEYTHADNGNIALTGEIDVRSDNSFLLSIGFGRNAAEAANQARSSLLDGFGSSKKGYIKNWKQWLGSLHNLKGRIYKESAAVLRMHEAKTFPGGIIASFSKPWGASKDDKNKGGYHVVWPRDLVETASGFLALKIYADALRVLNYLLSTQQADGNWPQNMWLEGTPHWKNIQMDQTALPLLLLDKCNRYKIIDPARMTRYWTIIKKAISYLIINGPYTQQDRWEEEKGYTPFTLATCIMALLGGADLAEANNEKQLAVYCRETADYWNDNIENWIYTIDTALAKKYEVDGYYIRINPFYDTPASALKDKTIELKNHKDGEGKILLNEIICVDALALVRFGLRAADDPKILNTVKLIDAELKVETPNGDCWHRYSNDGYGEDKNGNPYNGAGIGRVWPLLTGERAHYEIAAGNYTRAKELIVAMEAFSENGLLPEQVWDTDDIPEKNLYFGKHSGSAMPLTWAHAEYIKSCISLKNEKVFDMPPQAHERYIQQKITSAVCVWRFENQCKSIPANKSLRIEIFAAADIHWSDDNWKTNNTTHTQCPGIDLFFADIKAKDQSDQIEFTFFWTRANRWENKNFMVKIE
jgi:glucoamylase